MKISGVKKCKPLLNYHFSYFFLSLDKCFCLTSHSIHFTSVFFCSNWICLAAAVLHSNQDGFIWFTFNTNTSGILKRATFLCTLNTTLRFVLKQNRNCVFVAHAAHSTLCSLREERMFGILFCTSRSLVPSHSCMRWRLSQRVRPTAKEQTECMAAADSE